MSATPRITAKLLVEINDLVQQRSETRAILETVRRNKDEVSQAVMEESDAKPRQRRGSPPEPMRLDLVFNRSYEDADHALPLDHDEVIDLLERRLGRIAATLTTLGYADD